MINITEKGYSSRTATAEGRIYLKRETIDAISKKNTKKGDVIEATKVAATMATKNTPMLIPYCHNIPIEGNDIAIEIKENFINVSCTVSTTYKTGIEMEALTCVSTALLNIWDMVKYLEKDETGNYPETTITDIKVVKKIKKNL
ncbi:MAG: cyclic pyranopterin monophosphate synthase MoaC [Thermoplasmata archaeon]